jgi:uncharacterized membrane-anchored protein YitT (DUF2179 family)
MREFIKQLTQFKFWKELFIMTLGMSLSAAAVYYFLIPSKLVIGSISGLAIIVSALFANVGILVKVSWVVTIGNALLLIMAWLMIGKEFGAKTVYTSLILGPLIDFWEAVLPYQKLIEPGQISLMGDLWLDLLAFVLIISVAQAILFNINASTGGLDIFAKIVNKYFHMDIGKSVTITGALICILAFTINPFRLVVLGIIGTWINGLAIDHFTALLNRRKRVCIISDEHEKIRKYIIENLNRGCSLYELTGGYNEEKHIEIETLLTQSEFANLMNYLKVNNIQSFTTAGNVSEVYGMWNDSKKKDNK